MKRGVTVPTPENGQPQPGGNHSRKAVFGICFVLAMMVFADFGQTLRHEFVNYDDNDYVYENRAVSSGLNLEGIVWAFTQFHASNWHPVTWLSHMLDCQLYGLNPGGHHLTNVLLHAATAVLLFLVLRSMTGALWCSAFVAAAFAIHPLRVESVAWVAERKDLLCGLFFMLTLLAYARYAKNEECRMRNAECGRQWIRSGWYWVMAGFFALGLMSKPMLVTLPFVLLLLDYWPLRRLGSGKFQLSGFSFQVFIEKLPLFALSAASALVTVFAQKKATMAVEELSLPWRIGNALVSYVVYIRQTIWPAGLAAMYPHPKSLLPVSWVILSSLFLAAICVAVFLLRRRHPYAVTGWLWYLGMLVPVIGVMQVGSQAHADRYTYLPQIGVFVVVAWGITALTARWRYRRVVCGSAAALVLAGLAGCAWVQTSFWSDSATLWARTLDITGDNAVAHNNMGVALNSQGKAAEAVEHYRQALRILPGYADSHGNLGNALDLNGQHAEAVGHYRQALAIDPELKKVHGMLGASLLALGRFAEAIPEYRKSLEANPEDIANLNNLSWLLATCPETSLRNGSDAVELALQANRLSGGGNPSILDTLAAAYAEAANFPEAVATARRALDVYAEHGAVVTADAVRERLRLYESGLPYREEAQNR